MIKILIVDDHEVVRSGMRVILGADPRLLIVAEADNGSDAVARAIETQPDVAILDYWLPAIDGMQTARQIRLRVPKCEVLIFSMNQSEALVRDAIDAGAKGYLLKTDANRLLISAVKAVAAHTPFFTCSASDDGADSFAQPAARLLTRREREVVQLIAQGFSNKEVGRLLNISQKTVETHRASVMHKLNLSSTAAMVRYAVRNQLVEA